MFMFTKFGADSSSHFHFRARTQTHKSRRRNCSSGVDDNKTIRNHDDVGDGDETRISPTDEDAVEGGVEADEFEREDDRDETGQ